MLHSVVGPFYDHPRWESQAVRGAKCAPLPSSRGSMAPGWPMFQTGAVLIGAGSDFASGSDSGFNRPTGTTTAKSRGK